VGTVELLGNVGTNQIIRTEKIFNNHIQWQIVEKSLFGLSCRKIAKQLGVSKSYVSHIMQYIQTFSY
ncbi:10286_t:CDS:2, partial [Funneliformis geosporum]